MLSQLSAVLSYSNVTHTLSHICSLCKTEIKECTHSRGCYNHFVIIIVVVVVFVCCPPVLLLFVCLNEHLYSFSIITITKSPSNSESNLKTSTFHTSFETRWNNWSYWVYPASLTHTHTPKPPIRLNIRIYFHFNCRIYRALVSVIFLVKWNV